MFLCLSFLKFVWRCLKLVCKSDVPIFYVQGSIYSLFLYDSIYLYMTMTDQMVSKRLDWRNGTFYHKVARSWVAYGQ